jgi:hypothetical protein
MVLRSLSLLLLLAPGALLSIPALTARFILKLYSIDPNLEGTHLVYWYTNALTLPYSNFVNEASLLGDSKLDLPALLAIASYLFFLISLYAIFKNQLKKDKKYEPRIQTRIRRSVSFVYEPLRNRESLSYQKNSFLQHLKQLIKLTGWAPKGRQLTDRPLSYNYGS